MYPGLPTWAPGKWEIPKPFFGSWVFRGYNLQESLENTLSVRGTPNCPLNFG